MVRIDFFSWALMIALVFFFGAVLLFLSGRRMK